MNTKPLLLFALFLLLFSQPISSGAIMQKQSQTAAYIIVTNNSHDHKQNNNDMWNWKLDLPDASKITHKPNDEDDGKSQHFHFERFAKHRKKMLISLSGKFILVLAHLSSLLMVFVQLLH